MLPTTASHAMVGPPPSVPSFNRCKHSDRDVWTTCSWWAASHYPLPLRDARLPSGVDIHDQLRLQRYSLQFSVRFRKYYKTIFLGLVDMAMVNACIVYREAQKQQGKPLADHSGFLEVLQAQLLQTTGADFIEEILSPGPATPSRQPAPIASAHKLSEFPEWVQVREGFRERPQHQCEVCSIRKTKVGQRSATRFFCEACSDGTKRVYLCDRVRPDHYTNNNMTCHQIWHIKWKDGEERPRPRIGRDIQMRGLGKKRRRREDTTTNEEAEQDEGAESNAAPEEEETGRAGGGDCGAGADAGEGDCGAGWRRESE